LGIVLWAIFQRERDISLSIAELLRWNKNCEGFGALRASDMTAERERAALEGERLEDVHFGDQRGRY
jgi:hypothetical protein